MPIPVLNVRDGNTWKNIPAIKGDKGDKGDRGNVLFAGFSVDPTTGKLIETVPENFGDYTFSVNTYGHLEVTV